jgi:hypothetical protein
LCGAYLSVSEGNGSTYPTYSVSDKESVFSISISTSADNSTVAEAFSLTDQYCFVRNLIPYGGTNAYDLGSSNAGKSWNNIYSVNAVTVTSDQNLKTAFGEINPQESEYIIRNVKPISFNWDKQVVPTADNNRHVGFIAQEMEDVLNYTSLKDTIVHKDDNSFYGLRATELIPILWADNQALHAKVDLLTEHINEMMEKFDYIHRKLQKHGGL